MTKLYLIRHAEAEGNLFRRLHGQYNSGITPRGYRQIQALRRRFEGQTIDAVYASDLSRTSITAEALSLPRGLPICRDRRLREVDVGCWEDIPFGYLERFDAQRMHCFSTDVQQWSVERSETWPDYTGRMIRALSDIARAHEGQTVAVFSHGLALRALLLELFFPAGSRLMHCENTAVSCLHYHEGKFLMEFFNDASHIGPEIATLGLQLRRRAAGHEIMNLWYRDAQPEDGPLLQRLGCPQGPELRIRVAILGDEPVGCLALDGGLRYLALLPEARGFGLAQQLVGEAVSLFRRAGASGLALTGPVQDDTARGLFAACGFADGSFCLVPRSEF